jgi:hypothetical protein
LVNKLYESTFKGKNKENND